MTDPQATETYGDPGEDPTGESTATSGIRPTALSAEEKTPAEDAEEAKPTNREARYRRQLRDTEAERDGLRGRLATLQRGEVERLATADLQNGADLWAAGVDLDDLLDEDGNVDAAKVSKACKDVTAERPHWKRVTRTNAGLKSGSSAERGPAPTPWAAAFVRKER